MNLTCAIIDDDSISRAMVQKLAEKTRFLSVEGSFESPQDAARWLTNNNVDLLFLDMEMPEMNGLEMLRTLSYQPQVIIISGKSNYAVDAFDLSLADYLVKPVTDYPRFLAAVNKAAAKLQVGNVKNKNSEYLFIKIDSLLLKLDISTILWIEAFGDYVKIQTTDKIHTIYSTLKKIEDSLDHKKFVRVHRSYIVNISKIVNIDPNNLEINKKIIPISGTYKEDLFDRIKIL